MVNTVKRIRDCVFCGSRPLTFEHVIPKWVSKLPAIRDVLEADKTHGKPHHLGKNVLDFEGQTIALELVERGKKFPLNAIEVKVVCDPCNSGWMSALEVEVAPYLIPMIHRETTVLSVPQLANLAKWCIKTSMMFEFNDYSTISFSDEQRRALHRSATIPAGIHVRAARFEDDFPLRLAHSGGGVGNRARTQQHGTLGATGIVLGKVAFLVHNASNPEFVNLVANRTSGRQELWHQIWPPSVPDTVTHVAWGPGTPVGHEDITRGALVV